MDLDLYHKFRDSQDTLRIYHGNELLFSSRLGVLHPLLEYIERSGDSQKPVIILDRVMGNAAALLSVRAGAREVLALLGSQPAKDTLTRYKVAHYLGQMVPFILTRDGRDICPMEKLSLSQEMSPEEFHQEVKRQTHFSYPAIAPESKE